MFLGFWLSRVPEEPFDDFRWLVQESLTPAGRVCFVDDALRTSDELRDGLPSSSTIVRRTSDGGEHRLVKVPYDTAELQDRLAPVGCSIEVHEAAAGRHCS